MKSGLCLLCLLVWIGSLELRPVQFPEDGFVKGWKCQGTRLTFGPDRLFSHIDGGAELFLEFGFEDLQLQKYRRGDAEIAVEAYRMENPTSALGIYLLQCGQESPIEGIAARNSGDRYQMLMIRGGTFVVINNFSGDRQLLPVMIELASRVLASLAPFSETEAGPVLDLLPRTDQIPGTQRIIRGPYSLQSIYTFGDGDVLLLDGKIFGAAADYRKDNGSVHSRIVVRYPDETKSGAAFRHLLNHLDSYIRVLDRSGSRFVFSDFQNRFGRVELVGDTIDIGVRYSRKPGLP